ncbi:hypothetical protein LSH36_404g03020 [Paralvinella palmiformis]|uniref:G-protein coupled receptors family 1 profile domain-containing protein n=1 Tax=Paralvinella palmiformis TaxID=53620 RepID=A0AAD9JCC2_9ANNE|nr:hypothetical protein LSH36_404g03020 [Paralvinella palmiformis]
MRQSREAPNVINEQTIRRLVQSLAITVTALLISSPMTVAGSGFPLQSPTNSDVLGLQRDFGKVRQMSLYGVEPISTMEAATAAYGNGSANGSDVINATLPNADGQAVCESGSWELYLKLACVPFLTLVGLVGNTLSFVVMYSPLYNRKSYSYYLRALAVSDNFNLIVTCVQLANEASFQMSGIRLLEQHTSATCQLTEFLGNVIWLVSSWLIVCFTIDRYIAVCHPLQRARLCTETSARVSILLVVLGAMASQLYVFAFVQRVDRHSTSHCHAPSELRIDYFKLDIYWFSFTLRFMAPFLVIATCNGLIIFHIKRTRHRRRSLDQDRRYRNSNMAICTLYLVCAVFVATLFPNAIISTILMTEVLIFKRSVMYCRLLVVNTPFQMIRLINYSMNFVLYGLSGRQFRREFVKLLTCRLQFSGFHDRVREVVMHKIYVNGYRIRSASPSPKTEKSR